MAPSSRPIREAIKQSVGNVMQTPTFQTFLSSESLAPGDLVLFNNSFVYRDTVRTSKSSRYLALKAATSSLGTTPVVVTWDGMNADFKSVSHKSSNVPLPVTLPSAIREELGRFGQLVFALIGSIDEGASTEVPLTGNLRALRFDPGAAVPAELDDDILIVNSIDSYDLLWPPVQSLLAARQDGQDLVAEVAPQFAKAVEDLRERSPRVVRIVRSNSGGVPSLLDQMTAHMGDEIRDYKTALSRLGSGQDRDAYNNVLRISYNFASDAVSLITLFVSICDLKPLVLWMTIAETFGLAEAFRTLPFGVAARKKPSLKQYAEIIAGARNRAFHDLFAFDRSFEVDLSNVALRAKRLLLFHTHGKPPEDAFDFEDRELVEVLRSFTRAPERAVSTEFWTRNLRVLEATESLAGAIAKALVMCRQASRGRPAGTPS